MKAFKISILAAAAACLAIQGLAADAKSTISLGMSGYIDSNYNFDVNAKNGTLNLNQVGLDITATDSSLGIKGVASLTKSTEAVSGIDYLSVAQLYAEKSFFDSSLDVKLGRFYTFVGFEGVPTVKNFNETYSLLFNAEPVNHDGLELTYTSNGFTALGMAAENSYDTSLKDYGLQLGYAKGDASISANYLRSNVTGFSHQGSHAAVTEDRDLFNVVASDKVLDSLQVAAEYFYITQMASPNDNSDWEAGINIYPDTETDKSPKQQGYSLYSCYTVGSFSLAPRFTTMFMPDGPDLMNSTGAAPKTAYQYTLTGKYVVGSFTAYLEGNALAGSDDSFHIGTTKEKTQTNVLLGGSYQF
jgi:hypothetical protein